MRLILRRGDGEEQVVMTWQDGTHPGTAAIEAVATEVERGITRLASPHLHPPKRRHVDAFLTGDGYGGA